MHQIAIWDNVPNHDSGYPKSRFGTIYQITIRDIPSCDLGQFTKSRFEISQVLIWDNVPNHDSGYPKFWFGIMYQITIRDIPNCDLVYPKFWFGISQIAIWDNVPNRDLGISQVLIWDIPNCDLEQSSIWDTTISQIEMRIWDIRNWKIDLGYPKSQFGRSSDLGYNKNTSFWIWCNLPNIRTFVPETMDDRVYIIFEENVSFLIKMT